MRPEDALAAARAAAAERAAAGDPPLPGLNVEATERASIEQLMEWAVIEPDVDLMRSTRRWGRPITAAKRALLHVLRQYTRELQSQQTRFNLHVVLRLAELEERQGRAETDSTGGTLYGSGEDVGLSGRGRGRGAAAAGGADRAQPGGDHP